MSEAKFTKGPWRWDADRLVSEDEWVLSPEYDSHSGWAYIDACDEDKNLIAAAPELYEKLDEIRIEAEGFISRKGGSVTFLDEIISLLAKARGEHE